ncbi:MAG: hypothetical protein AAGA66_01295, partial [Bacteroidota bacterium]
MAQQNQWSTKKKRRSKNRNYKSPKLRREMMFDTKSSRHGDKVDGSPTALQNVTDNLIQRGTLYELKNAKAELENSIKVRRAENKFHKKDRHRDRTSERDHGGRI